MGRRRKGESKPDDARIEARRQRAFEMRRGGGSYRAIGAALGVSHEIARQDVAAIMEQVNAESREMAAEYRSIQIERLDAMLTAIWPRALKANPENPQAQMAAVDRVLRIEERRAKLLGLDAPQAVDLSTPSDRPFTVRVIFADDHDSE